MASGTVLGKSTAQLQRKMLEHVMDSKWNEAARYADALLEAHPVGMGTGGIQYRDLGNAFRSLHIASISAESEEKILREAVIAHGDAFKKVVFDAMAATLARAKSGAVAHPQLSDLLERGRITAILEDARRPYHDALTRALKENNPKRAIKAVDRLLSTHVVGSPAYDELLSLRRTEQSKRNFPRTRRFFARMFLGI